MSKGYADVQYEERSSSTERALMERQVSPIVAHTVSFQRRLL